MPTLAIAAVIGGGGFFIAAEGQGLPSWAQVLIAMGVAFGLITKQLVPGWIYTDTKSRLEATEQDLKEAHQKMIDIYQSEAPALKAAQEATAEAMTELRLYRTMRAEGRSQ